MKRIIHSIVVVSAITCSVMCHAQSGQDLVNKMMPKPVPASPNVASLGKFGDYQVSHFTGLPDISIPIFEAKSGNLSVPITLSYHASGNKPTDLASWVGLGWSLASGGQISRTVNGKPDEDHYLTHPLNPTPTIPSSYYYLQYAASGLYDTEGDVFSYSYPGNSGKFLLPNGGTYTGINGTAPNGGAYLVPYAPIIINRVNGNKYEITNENGVLYRFGTNNAGTTSTEVTNAFNGGNPTLHATTAWNLMEMQAPNSNDAISFTYQDVGHAYRHDVAYTYLVLDQCFAEVGATCPTATHSLPQLSNIDSDVNQEGLSEILFETGKVEFIMGTNPRADASQLRYLDKIIVKSLVNGTYVKVKTIQFLYSYFTNAAGSNTALKLDGIQFLDNSDAIVQKYKFWYFTNSFSWNPSESNFMNARDLWGYYNGALQNTDLFIQKAIPYQTTIASQPGTVTIGGALDRSVNAQFIKEGVLSRIDFPTGGYTEFDYESHKYLNDQSVETAAGGLRVVKITSKDDPAGVPIVKTYKYGNATGSPESGVGKALFISNQFNYSSSQIYSNDCGSSDDLNYQIRTYHSNSSFSIDASSPVVYPYVTEYFGDPSGTTNGKIMYEFDAGFPAADVDHVLGPSTKYYKNSLAWKRGKLTRKTVFDNSDNKLSETIIGYTTYKEEGRLVGMGAYAYLTGTNVCAPLGFIQLNEIGEQVNSETYKWTTYSQNSGALLESETQQYTYKNGDVSKYVYTSTAKTYDANKVQVTQTVSTHSNSSEQSVTINTYPFQLTAANVSSTGAAKGVYMLNTKNIISTPLETYTYLQKPDNTNRRIVSGQVTTFKQNPNNANHVVPDQIYVWESANRVSSYTPVAINGGNNGLTINANQKPRISMLEYDATGNILAVAKTNDVPVSYKWGYNNSLPIVEITNTLPKNVFTTSFEEETANVWVGGKTGKNSNNNTGYSKALSQLDPGTYILAYYKLGLAWDYFETTVTVPANGLYTIVLPAGRYDEIRFYPKNAQITTYTYDPLVGMTSMTDPNGTTTYYDYDTFSRLKLIKDNNTHILKAYDYRYKILN